MVVGVRVVKKWKAWLIGITVFLVIGGISFGTYLFIQKSMADLDAKKSDNESPVLEVKDVTINKGELYKVEDFVNSCEDNLSEECSIEFKEKKMADYQEPGEYEIILRAIDDKENETLKTVKLTIKGDGEIIPEEEKTEIKESLQESIETNPNIENKTEEIKELPPLEVKPPKILMEEGTAKEEFIETRDVYGTTCEYLVTTYYTTYTDGTKREMGTTESLIDCTYSTYNATLEDLAYEAGTQMVTYADYIANVIILLNQKRVENGLKEFVLDVELSVAAELRSLEVGYSNNLSYTRPNTTQNILDELAISYQDSGEYILKDISEPTIVASSVLQNENMNKLIYDDFYTRIGVGLAFVHNHYYWTIYVVA